MVYGLPAGVSLEVVKLAWPLPFSVTGPPNVGPGLAQLPPLKKVTLPAVTGFAPLVTVAVNATDSPYLEGLLFESTVVLVFALLTTWLTFPLLALRSAVPP